MADKPPVRGLPSIAEARDLRATRKLPAASGKFWLWSLLAIVAISIFYWKKTQGENERTRARILAKQRSVADESGKTWLTLRERVERWTTTLAKDWTGKDDSDLVDADLKGQKDGGADLWKKPGLYLRVTRDAAKSPETIRAAAKESVRDAFTACLMKRPHADAHEGKACKKSKECEKGQICNEVGVCAKPSEPYNLRVLYRGMQPLDEIWVRDVETATDELRLRLRETEIDEAQAADVPLANEVLRRAEYLLLVVDEVPKDLKPDPERSVGELVQLDPHPVRVAVVDLKADKLLLRVRRSVDAAIPAVPGPAQDAIRRQILNCSLAESVRDAISAQH